MRVDLFKCKSDLLKENRTLDINNEFIQQTKFKAVVACLKQSIFSSNHIHVHVKSVSQISHSLHMPPVLK